jgi:hypothetical protein
LYMLQEKNLGRIFTATPCEHNARCSAKSSKLR